MQNKHFRLASVGIGVTLLAALIAELFRLKGLLLVDLWVPLFTGAWILSKFLKKEPLKIPLYSLPAVLFLFVGTASLLMNSYFDSNAELLNGLFYGVRWAGLFLLSWVVLNEEDQSRQNFFYGFLGFAVLLSLAGFVQLAFMPDFTEFEILGWDPHQGRLLSTWFDPNFVGGFLAFALPFFFAEIEKHVRQKDWRLSLTALVATGFVALALLLTQSRSAYLALIMTVGLYTLFRSPKLLLVAGIAGLLAYGGLSPIRNRVNSLATSVQSVFTETYAAPDASARLRFGSWEEGWRLFTEKPIWGHGYNRYEAAALQSGFLKDTEIHSASGSDSSLLTILASTGALGFAFYWLTLLMLLVNTWKNRSDAVALAFFAGLGGLLIHSIFVNSLLFPLLLAPFWIAAGLIPGLDYIKVKTNH